MDRVASGPCRAADRLRPARRRPPGRSAAAAGCSGNAEDDVRAAAEAFLDDWADGDPRGRRRDHRPGRRHRAARADGGRTCPTPRSPPSSARSPSRTARATVGWTATWDLAAAPDWSYDATLRARGGRGRAGRWSPSRRSCTRSWGRGSTSSSPAALPERAPITDAAGRPAVHPDRGGQRRRRPRPRSPTCRRWPPALSAATGIPAEDIVADVAGRPRGPVRPGHHPAPAGLRGDPRRRSSTCPARSSRPTPACWRPAPASPSALLGRVGAATAEVIEESQDDGVAAVRRRRRARALRAAARLPGAAHRHPGLHRVGGQHRRGHRRRRAARSARSSPRPGTPRADAAGARGPERRRRRRGRRSRCPPTSSSSGPAPGRSWPSPPTRRPTRATR